AQILVGGQRARRGGAALVRGAGEVARQRVEVARALAAAVAALAVAPHAVALVVAAAARGGGGVERLRRTRTALVGERGGGDERAQREQAKGHGILTARSRSRRTPACRERRPASRASPRFRCWWSRPRRVPSASPTPPARSRSARRR